MPKFETYTSGAAGKSFIPDPTGVRAGLPKSKDQAEGDIDQGSTKTATPGQSEKLKRAGPRSGLGGGAAGGERTPVAQGSSKVATPGQGKTLTAEDINIDDDVDQIFEGTDFTEEFKDKAKTIFEHVVVARINEELESLQEELQEELEQYRLDLQEELTAQLDKYLNYVVEQWMEDNALAVETGIKTEMVESFLSGFKNLMQEHYVEIPEEQSDVLEQLAARVADLESTLGEEIERNVELTAILNDYARAEIFDEVAEGLTDTQVEKLEQLAEAIAAENVDEFAEKLEELKESYFSSTSTNSRRYEVEQFDEGEIVDLNEEGSVKVTDPVVARAAATISRLSGRK